MADTGFSPAQLAAATKTMLEKQKLIDSVATQPEDDSVPSMRPLSPHVASILGGLMDAASTYRFLKRGTGSEANSLVKGLNNSPGKVGGLALAMVPAIQLAGRALHKVAPRMSDAILANQGALQMGYGASNLSHELNPAHDSSSAEYRAALARATVESLKRR